MAPAAQPGPLAIMGGAFDPVHFGHLRTALELQTAYDIAELRLVPSANPPHRQPHIASPALRQEMLEAATTDLPGVAVDPRELHRDGLSYSVFTLTELRAEWGQRSLCMIVGMDAFLGLPHWYRWTELVELAHIVVAHRPGWQPPQVGVLGDFFGEHRAHSPAELHAQPAGHIFVHEVTQLEISSSAIRAQLASGASPRYLMPDAALQIALQTACYARPESDNDQEIEN